MSLSDHKLADIHIKIEQLRIGLSELRKELQECDKTEPVVRRSPSLDDLYLKYHLANNSLRGLRNVQHHILTELRDAWQQDPDGHRCREHLNAWIKENE